MMWELSPQTITLAIIIKLYLSNDFPSCKFLLVFITQLLEGNISTDDVHSLNPTLLSLCHSICQTSEKYRRKGIEYGTDEEQKSTSYLVQLKLLTVLWSVDSADLLLHIVNETYELVPKPSTITYDRQRKISQRSTAGRFLQKLAVSAKLLHFDESSLLFADFCMYRQTTCDYFNELQKLYKLGEENFRIVSKSFSRPLLSKCVSVNHTSNDTLLTSEQNDEAFYKTLNTTLDSLHDSLVGRHESHHLTPSHINSLVENQIRLLQKHGTSTPASLRLMLSRMASSEAERGTSNESYAREISSIHYLTYLETLHSGDYRGAFDSLHRYFDYMVSKGSRYFYHFALVSKASLHQHFGENEKALDSIEEAISVARENKDNSTLTYILSWLFDFVRKNPSLWKKRTFSQMKNNLQLLDSLVRKSSSISLLLAAISYRFEFGYYLNNGACFARYYESLFKSNYLSINDHITSFIGGCQATSDLWAIVGFPHLMNLYNDLGLFYSKKHGTSADVQEFRFRKNQSSQTPAERIVMTDCDITDISASRGLRHKFLFQSVEDSLKKGRYRLASELLNTLPAHSELDQDCRVEMLRLSALVQSAHGNFDDALASLDKHLFDTSTQNVPFYSQLYTLKINIIKSQLMIQSGIPFRAFSLTLQLMEIAKLLGFLRISLQGCSLLIKILQESGDVLNAYMLALSSITCMFCVNDPTTTSSISFDLALACFELLKLDSIPINITKTNLFEQCLKALSTSVSCCKQTEDLEGLSKCFELESKISAHGFSLEGNQNASLFTEFSDHSLKGLEILRKRTHEECGHSYVR